jgi:oxygen-independent coproporphyrinogen-3 oxidase
MIPKLGLYIHIPFCANLCHYCDFAKTANFDESHVDRYFNILSEQLSGWINRLGSDRKFSSVFFGGGTPGLFTKEYLDFFRKLEPALGSSAEITLEANPGNITPESLQFWQQLGVTRLSIGVQSFDPLGLKTMTRDHSESDAKRALDQALKIFTNVNGDLIYGWPGQTRASWIKDLETMTGLGASHLSLYALTFEGRTPFTMAQKRGVLNIMDEDEQAWRYDHACSFLAACGFDHEEISNWSKPGFSCRHNWLYWTASPYIGIGAGAHGFHDQDNTSFGTRYSYPGDLRTFLKTCRGQTEGQTTETNRTLHDWLTEYVGCALRCKAGVDLKLLQAKGFQFTPTKLIEEGISRGMVLLSSDRIRLTEQEWFRETAWSSILLASIHAAL